MAADRQSLEPIRIAAVPADPAWRFLHSSARLLLEYNVRAHGIERALQRIARHLGAEVQTIVGYREVTLAGPEGASLHALAPEFRIDVAVGIATQRVIDDLCLNRIGLAEAVGRLNDVERLAPRHRRWVVVLLLGLAASALAWLLRADAGAVVVSGVSSSLGLLARQALARRSVVLFAHPFAAGLIGAVLGGLAIRLGWTGTPGICLIVPALMVVPGPHLINGVHDMLDNHMQTGICRLGLATGILVATAFGVVLGGWLALGATVLPAADAAGMPLTLPLDMALAGVAACGFGAFYNAPWRVLWVSVLCGMVGHGLRYMCLEQGIGVAMSTLIACVVIGLMAESAAKRLRLPFPAIAFAGAVPMMPGLFIYQSITGAMRLSAGVAADPVLAATTLAHVVTSMLVVAAMVIGLLLGARLANLAPRQA
jgi:uncharacterized membrane protein YjjP (DUF1212 family)